MALPLFGFPGGIELLIIVFISLLLFSPLVALVYLVLFRGQVETADEERITALEEEVDDLRARLEDADADSDVDDGGGSGDVGGASSGSASGESDARQGRD